MIPFYFAKSENSRNPIKQRQNIKSQEWQPIADRMSDILFDTKVTTGDLRNYILNKYGVPSVSLMRPEDKFDFFCFLGDKNKVEASISGKEGV